MYTFVNAKGTRLTNLKRGKCPSVAKFCHFQLGQHCSFNILNCMGIENDWLLNHYSSEEEIYKYKIEAFFFWYIEVL